MRSFFSPRSKVKSKRGFSALVFIPLAVFAMLFSALTPAFADGGTGGSGPGGSGDGTFGGTYNVAYECHNGTEGWIHFLDGSNYWQPRFTTGFPPCYGAYVDTNLDKICNVGFDVWNFYQQGGNISAWTESRVYFQEKTPGGQLQRCGTGAAASATFYYPNPNDATSVPVGTKPWAAARSKNLWGQTVTTNDLGQLTTNPPVVKGGSCTSLQNGSPGHSADPLLPYFTTLRASADAQTFRNSLYKDVYLVWKSRLNSAWAGLSVINSKAPAPTSGNTIHYGDGINCSSNADFTTSASTESPIDFGSCWIPVDMRAHQYVNAANSADIRYAYYKDSDTVYTQRGVIGGERYETTTPAYAAQKNDHPSWRNAIYDIVKGNLGSLHPMQAYTGVSKQDPANYDLAGRQAAIHANCGSSTGLVATNTNLGSTQKPATSVNLTVTSPTTLNTGGQLYPAAFTVAPGGLNCVNPTTHVTASCSSVYGASAPTLKSLHFGSSVTGTTGYTKCAATTTPAASCDFTSTNQSTRISASTKGIDGTSTSTNYLYYATLPTQTLRLTINGGNAGSRPTATQMVPVSTQYQVQFCPTAAFNGTVSNASCTKVSFTQTVLREQALTVKLVNPNGTPWIPTSQLYKDYKVIGAVNNN